MTTLVDHKTKTELALQVLRDRIRTGQFEPGQRLRLKDLTADLGMSPTPIREALRLLQADGFVDYRPHQGIVVAELSLSEVDGVLRLRRLLEPFAVELAVPALTRAQSRELERLHARLLAAVASGRGTAVSEYNAAWHWAIYERRARRISANSSGASGTRIPGAPCGRCRGAPSSRRSSIRRS